MKIENSDSWFLLDRKGQNRGSELDASLIVGTDGGCNHVAAAMYSDLMLS